MNASSLSHGGSISASGRAAALRLRGLTTPTHLGVIGLTAGAGVLRFYGLARQGFWFDEASTALLVHLSPGQMLGLIPQTESTPPLYYLVAWIWTRGFGFGEAGLRSLSALAGVLVMPVAYGAAARLLGHRAGLIAAALTACNPLLIWYSQEARSYELLVLLTGVALLAFAYGRESPSERNLLVWTIAAALALATHYYAVVAIAPQAAWLAFEHRRQRPVRIAVATVVVCGLGLIPLALSQHATGHDSWIANSPLHLRLAQIIPQFEIGTGAPARPLLKFLAMALVLIALGLLAIRGRAAERRPAALAGGLAIAGFILSLAFVVAGSDALITRNIISLLPPTVVLVAGGLAVTRARRVGVIVTVALCAIGVRAAVGVAAERNLQRPDWRLVARALGAQPASAPSRVILIQHYRTLLPLSLYLPDLKVLGDHDARVGELDVISISSPEQPLCWWGAACNLIPSQMQSGYAIAGFHLLWRRRVAQFEIMRLVANRPVPLSRRTVAAALRTTNLRRDDLLVQPPTAGARPPRG